MLILTVFTALSAFVCAEQTQEEATLKIYLPREITIDGSTPNLGQIAIIRGDESLIAKASGIALGHIATPEQKLIIDRNIILSRLACNGIPASFVTLTGAEETCIKRRHQFIAGSRFVEEATAFLKKNPPHEAICQIDALRAPKNMTLPNTAENITLVCRLLANGARNQCTVLVIALQDDKEVGQQEVPFRFRYHCRKVVTKKAIAKGEAISTENVTVENSISNYPEPAGWAVPYGLIAKRDLPANTVITNNLISSPKPVVLIKRNQSVVISIENAGLIASATGKALQNGAVGEFIKVQNVDSKIIIMARVNEDGTVSPVY